MIGWALRRSLLWIGVSVVIFVLASHRAAFLPAPPPPPAPAHAAAPPPPVSDSGEEGRLVYLADPRGHFVLDAAVNGASMRMLVDTGATFVALTPRDARAAGFMLSDLAFTGAAHTANGIVRFAPVRISEIDIDDLSVYDVRATVIENLNVSLLGMSFLDRLKGYEMRDGKLYISR